MTVKPCESGSAYSEGGIGVLVLFGIVVIVFVVVLVVALPALHDALDLRVGHYVTWKRATQAENARAIIKDPRSDCNFHNCQSSVGSRLRVCKGNLDGVVVWAAQWLNQVGNEWREGTSFLQRTQRKRDRYLRANQCDGL